jgi:phosphatidylglycerophosphatase A
MHLRWTAGEQRISLRGEISMQRVVILLATGFFVGYSPFVPGTTGTLASVPLYLLMSRLSPFYYGIILFGSMCIAVWAANEAEVVLQARDCRHIVIDEMVGFFVTMFMIPPTMRNVVLGFFFFRAFDIVKPYPIRFLEDRVPGGYGIVLDDMMAGIYANLAVRILLLTVLRGG